MIKIEVRADDSVHIEGYVNAVERDSKVINVPSVGKCVEQIRAGAFENALNTAPDVLILENHNTARRLGSIKDGNLKLYEDNIGLRAIADISDNDIAEKARHGEIRGWSFGFICTDQEIEQRSGNVPRRIVKALSLSEVSLIDGNNIPCYKGTLVEVRAEGDIDILEYRDGIEESTELVSTNPGDDVENRAEETFDYDSYYDAVLRYLELRYNPYHDDKGRFCSGGGSGGGAAVVVQKGTSYRKDKAAYGDQTAKFLHYGYLDKDFEEHISKVEGYMKADNDPVMKEYYKKMIDNLNTARQINYQRTQSLLNGSDTVTAPKQPQIKGQMSLFSGRSMKTDENPVPV